MSKITEASRDHIADEVTDTECDAAWKRIKSAAKEHKIELDEQDWRELS